MKRSVITLTLATIFSSQSLLAMEHEYNQLSKDATSINDYGSLTEYVTIDREEQKEALINQMDQFAQSNLDDYHPMFTASLSTLSKDLHYMSPEDKHRTIQQLPTNLLMSKKISLLLQVLMVFPPEIVKNIYRYVLDDEKEAAEVFCELPFAHALEMCQEIRTRRVNDAYTIGSLFVKYYGSRDTLAKTHNKRWYSYAPVVSSKDKEEIDLLDDDIRIAFLQDQPVLIDYANVESNPCLKLQYCFTVGLPEPWSSRGRALVGGLLGSGVASAFVAAAGGTGNLVGFGIFVPLGFVGGVVFALLVHKANIMILEPHKEAEEVV